MKDDHHEHNQRIEQAIMSVAAGSPKKGSPDSKIVMQHLKLSRRQTSFYEMRDYSANIALKLR